MKKFVLIIIIAALAINSHIIHAQPDSVKTPKKDTVKRDGNTAHDHFYNLTIPITPEEFKKASDIIKKYAPSPEALQIVNNLAAVLNMTGRPADSRFVYTIFKPFFPDRRDFFDRQAAYYTSMMLMQDPDPSSVHAFDAFINESAPSEDAFVAVQRLAEPFIGRSSWDTAIAVYKLYMPLFPNMTDRFTLIIGIMAAPEEGITVRNLGPVINSGRAEWDPTPTPDGRYLYFSSNNRRGGLGKDDVWVSKIKDSTWQKPVNLGKPLNGRGDETVDNVTPDGTGLMLSGTFDSTLGFFDIYYAEKTPTGWGSAQHLPSPVNTEFVDEGACLTPDGKAIIFSSDRPGAIGGFRRYSEPYHGSIPVS